MCNVDQIQNYTKKYGSLDHVEEKNGVEENKENGENKSDVGSELSETSDLENHSNNSDQEVDDEEEKNMSDDESQIIKFNFQL